MSELAFKFRSEPITGPIEEMGILARSLLFAELSEVAYLAEDSAATIVDDIGLKETLFFDHGGAQAYIFKTPHDCIVACRGTEPTDFNDIKADLNAMTVLAETIGKVHRGFKKEVDDLWPTIEAALEYNEKTLWFTGHSLGGAMATICASRCFLSIIRSMPKELYTFGSPRCGNSQYVNHVGLTHYRWVNNNDVVTKVPPAWLGYRHTGEQMYLNAYGKLRPMTKAQRTKDKWRGFVMGIKKRSFDHFSDHIQMRYIESIANAIEEEKAGIIPPVLGAKIALPEPGEEESKPSSSPE